MGQRDTLRFLIIIPCRMQVISSEALHSLINSTSLLSNDIVSNDDVSALDVYECEATLETVV